MIMGACVDSAASSSAVVVLAAELDHRDTVGGTRAATADANGTAGGEGRARARKGVVPIVCHAPGADALASDPLAASDAHGHAYEDADIDREHSQRAAGADPSAACATDHEGGPNLQPPLPLAANERAKGVHTQPTRKLRHATAV
jgi:hypothetical protein